MGFREAVERVVSPDKLRLGCDKCTLDRSQFVPAKVVPGAKIVLIGEAPGATEVKEGRPFCGKAGDLIRRALREEGIDPDSCSWENVVKCRPPDNEFPGDKIASLCGDRNLRPSLSGMHPQVGVILGANAFKFFFNGDELDKSRGNFRRWEGLTMMSTFHPARILHEGGLESEVGRGTYLAIRRDLSKVKRYLDGSLYSGRRYVLIKTPEEADRWSNKLCEYPLLACDIEATTLRSWAPGSVFMCISFCGEPGESICFPVDHREIESETLRSSFRAAVRKVLGSFSAKVWHHRKYDFPWLSQMGYEILGPQYCTMLIAYLLDENRRSYGLKQLTAQYLEGYSDIIEPGPFTPLDKLWYYNCEDSDNTLRLFNILKKQMTPKLWWVHDNLLIPGSDALAEAERVGVKVDLTRIKSLMEELTKETSSLVKECNTKLPPGKTVTSPKDLSEYLYDRMGYPVVKSTGKGGRSTDAEALILLRDDHNCEIANKILKIREMQKLTSTYLGSYPELAGLDGRIHCSFHLTQTTTGRLSSSDPNMQNVPNDKRIKTLIVAPDGYVFVYGDLSCAEMRVAGALSHDPALIEVFRVNGDVHIATAANVLRIPRDQINKDQRQKAKPVNFGFLYGQQPKGFVGYAKSEYGVEFTLEEATEIRERYFQEYKGLQPWYKEVLDELYRNEQVETVLGRIRRFPGLRQEKDRGIIAYNERQAINTKVQSPTSDLMLMTVTHVQSELVKQKAKSRVVLTVHDSLMAQSSEDEAKQVARLIYDFVGSFNFPWLIVPMRVDLEIGHKWGATEKMKPGVDF